jgi:glycine cleavage system transcriptional repressor
MHKRYVITLTASNRVGILAAVATALAELGGELREVKQTILDCYFTMILSADFPEHRDADVIVDHLSGMCERFDIKITLNEPDQLDELTASDAETTRFRLSLTGRDQPGLLGQIAARIARDEIDIVEMHAGRTDECSSFEIKMQLELPVATDVSTLTADLEEIGREAGLLAWLEELPSFETSLETPTHLKR